MELVGVCDENSNVLENLPLDASVKRFTRLSELLKEKPDLAIITTPSGLHPRQCIEAARAGCRRKTIRSDPHGACQRIWVSPPRVLRLRCLAGHLGTRWWSIDESS